MFTPLFKSVGHNAVIINRNAEMVANGKLTFSESQLMYTVGTFKFRTAFNAIDLSVDGKENPVVIFVDWESQKS